MNNKPITESSLMEKLKNSKKILEKLDGKEYTGGSNDHNYDDYSYDNYDVNESYEPEPTQVQMVNEREAAVLRIQNSGLPEAVKRAMIENPIEQPTINVKQTFNEGFVKNAKRLMSPDEGSKKRTPPPRPQNNGNGSGLKTEELIRIITETVEKVLDKKLGLIKESQKSDVEKINETLVLKVGNTIFKGKITEAKNVK